VSATGWKQFTPFYIYIAVAVCLISVIGGEGLSRTRIVLLLASGIVTWMLIEYVLHRFIFHYDARSQLGRRILHRTHLAHHENPGKTKPLSGLVLGLAIAPEILVVAWGATGSWRAAFYFLVGVAAGYFYYEWLHFYVHHARPRLKLFRYLRTYHLLHHHQTTELRFGVTSPLLDIIFKTFRPVSKPLLRR
jgi:sterol desaturase/sphingolipid hydroxylase (fatty acid hydroxylase superfamily)